MNDGRKEVGWGGVTPQTSDRSLLKNSWKKVTWNNSLKKAGENPEIMVTFKNLWTCVT